jgi:hypothetical protein
MPKEIRKRGKRAKKGKEEDSYIVYAKPEDKAEALAAVTGEEYSKPSTATAEEEQNGGYTHPSRQGLLTGEEQNDHGGAVNGEYDANANAISTSRWPAVDPDTKAYFKQLENQILEFENLHGDRLAQKAQQQQQQQGYGEEDEEEDLDRECIASLPPACEDGCLLL